MVSVSALRPLKLDLEADNSGVQSVGLLLVFPDCLSLVLLELADHSLDKGLLLQSQGLLLRNLLSEVLIITLRETKLSFQSFYFEAVRAAEAVSTAPVILRRRGGGKYVIEFFRLTRVLVTRARGEALP